MSIAPSTPAPPTDQQPTPSSLKDRIIHTIKNSWEIYPILVLATLFRVYGDNNANFNDDQAGIWNLARGAIAHHMLPASSNISSLGILHGYFTTYFLLVVALFTGNPVWGAVATGLFNVVGVLITYLFIRRYYGRLTGTLAALFYAISTIIVLYNRFIWQPNLEPVIAVCLMFALSVGAIERRKGWLIAATIFMALSYETHESSIYMIVPFVAGLILAGYKSIRWRDILFSIIALLIIFLPYILWLQFSNYSDINLLLNASKDPPSYSDDIFKYIAFFTSPYIHDSFLLSGHAMNGLTQGVNTLPSDPRSALAASSKFMVLVRDFLKLIHIVAPLMVLGGAVLVFLLLVKPRSFTAQTTSLFTRGKDWLLNIYNDPTKRGYILLLVWQCIVPLFMVRYTTPLYTHYILFLIPGPYILIALFVSKLIPVFPRYLPRWSAALRTVLYAVTALTILGELIGVSASVSDIARGVYGYSGSASLNVYPNDAPSARNAIDAADKLAQQHHISHIYVAANHSVIQSLQYFADMTPIPATIFDDTSCLFLPSAQSGPTVFLMAPDSTLTAAMLAQYTNATLVSQPQRVAGSPYQLYLLTSKAPTIQPQTSLTSTGGAVQMDLLDAQSKRISNGTNDYMVTRWQLSQNSPPAWRTTYEYSLRADYAGQPAASAHYRMPDCTTTDVQAGDQLLAAFQLNSTSTKTPTDLTIHTLYQVEQPVTFKDGPVSFLTYDTKITGTKILHNPHGHITVTLPGVS
ncbi:MAG TPA: glycosyltransferase family 39 protein [Dictyobacter sp.]|jgi:4-amino-4-deoxy-L-arabinose transferase-like glycosyltransferase|nr:glycosyltransferase family 39 protein [Dictyobacter sp.]